MEEEMKKVIPTEGIMHCMSKFKIKGPLFPFPEEVEMETGA